MKFRTEFKVNGVEMALTTNLDGLVELFSKYPNKYISVRSIVKNE